MAGGELTEAQRWFEVQSAGAPAPLRERAAHYLAGHSQPGKLAERLAGAAADALNTVLAHPGDRSVALDLLAADALVTLALKARACDDPAGLARFAARLRLTRESAR
jgi:hypothetical protein